MNDKGASVGLLLLFSMLLLLEGVTRTTVAIAAAESAGSWTAGFPAVVLLLAAISELVFSLLGLAVALSALFYGRLPSRRGLVGTIAAINVLGWFTLLVWVIAEPAYNAGTDNNAIAGQSNYVADSVTALGIAGGVSLCAALQGGQVVFLSDLAGHADESFERRRLAAATVFGQSVWYGALYLLCSLAQLAVGAFVQAHAVPPLVSPPWVVRYAGVAVAVGAVSTLLAVAGLARVALRRARPDSPLCGAPWLYHALLFGSWLLYLALTVITQIGLFGSAPPLFVAPLVALQSFAVHFMPAFFDQRAGQAK